MNSASMPPNLANLGILHNRGFLPEADPLISLPDNWRFLDQFGKELPGLITSGKIPEAARSLPIPSADDLGRLFAIERDRAMMIYAFGASAAIHLSKPSERLLCENIARPLWLLSKSFGKPPILSYCSYVLNNWARIDSSKDIEIDNLALLQNFIDLKDEDWFILIHVDIEKRAAQAIRGSVGAVAAAEGRNDSELIYNLRNICQGLKNMIETLKRMPEHCSMDVYFSAVRPWIMFFENVVYEGVEELNYKPHTFRGETGAQSSILPLLDGALGIYHERSPLTNHLKEMRIYMPPRHRALIDQIETTSGVRDFILS